MSTSCAATERQLTRQTTARRAVDDHNGGDVNAAANLAQALVDATAKTKNSILAMLETENAW